MTGWCLSLPRKSGRSRLPGVAPLASACSPLSTLFGVKTQGRGDPSVLVDRPSRESVSIKTLVLVAPSKYHPHNEKMTDYDSSMNGVNGSGTGETGAAASPDRCPTVGQGGPGRHPAIARMKWSRDMNIAVMECYYLSKPVDESGRPVREYRQRMHTVWLNRAETM